MTDIEEINKKILEILDKIRPVLKEDNGDVEFIKFDKETGFVHLRLLGACKICPLSQMTLQAGILRALKNEINEITRVKEVV